MSQELLVTAGPDKGRVFAIPDANPLIIGRAKETDTKLTDPHASRIHCQVEMDGGQLVLTNKSSASGTFVNGKRVGEPCILSPGDVIRIGETELRYVSADAAATTRVVPATATARPAESGAEGLLALSGNTLAYFEVADLLYKGPISALFKARDTKEERAVALKVFAPEFSKDDEDRQRFIRAMKTMLPLRHPNLVTVYGAGKTGAYCWISMELVEGESATQMIQRIGLAGMLDWRNGLRVAVHVARALEFAQQHSIIHRNITPQNILVQSSDKLTKLGGLMLAKAMEGTLAEPITRPGEILGDVRYMSPERTRGTTDVDGRSDIYSLGATVYALLTGRPPFEGGSLVETITKIRNEPVVKPTKYQLAIPGLLEGAVLKMLEKRPEDRFQSASDLVRDLERVAKFQGLAV